MHIVSIHRMRPLFLLASAIILALPTHAVCQGSGEFKVSKYSVVITPNIAERSIEGSVSIEGELSSPGQSQIALDSGDLEILTVTAAGEGVPFVIENRKLKVSLPAPNNTPELNLHIEYQGIPQYGMKFAENEVSTAFSTSQWMPSINAPSARAEFEISLIIPEDFVAAAPGKELPSRKHSSTHVMRTWTEIEPMPAYLYGFVAGEFKEVIESERVPTLRFLAPPIFTEEEIATIFKETRTMISFFEEKSGISFPSEIYTQVLLRNGAGQELDDMAVFSKSYGSTILSDETATWLIAHEVAHQWWGNKVTNHDWTHFWLNEGIVSFMTAAFLGHRYGPEAYSENINAARAQYQFLANSGKDKPLVFPDWDSSTREDRSIVYNKGAYVVHLLKELMGDEMFWQGIRHYTSKHWGKSVTTMDFKNALEESTSINLDQFFNTWVF